MSQRRVKMQRREQREVASGDSGGNRGVKIAAAGVALVAIGAVLVSGVLASRGNENANRPVRANASATDDAVELSGTDPVTGRHVDLASFRGKAIVLNVWGSWCPGCNDEAIDLRRFQEKHPNVQVVGIDLNDTTAGAKTFYRRWGWKHPSISDPKGEIASSLGLQGTPTTFFLNQRHQIVTQIVGATDLAGFDQGLRAATSS